MKFRQRQILLSVVLLCGLVFLLLHSRTPQDTDLDFHARDGDKIPPLAPPVKGGDPLRRDSVLDFVGEGRGAEQDANEEREENEQPFHIDYVQRSPGSECAKVLRPATLVREPQTFQVVDNQPNLYVFSAFLEKQEGVVRIVGLNSLRVRTVFCMLWYGSGEMKVVSDVVQNLPEHHGKRYSAAYITCRLPDYNYPYAVTVTSQDCRTQNPDAFIQPSNVLLVQQSRGLQHNFTLCVTALNYKYSRAYELVEMIELNRMLGADQFTFYVNSVGDNVAKVLRWYEKRGLVQLVSWKLPVRVDHWPPDKSHPPEVHYFAQLASHNDCLNRNRGRSRYLVYQDLDEFIIPKKHLTWEAMLNSLRRTSSAYLFKCVFFRKDWPLNSENFTGRAIADKFKSIVLSTDKREPKAYPHSQRAKYIINPQGIHIVGIHNIWKYRGTGGTSMTNVMDGDALLHHYRSWENPNDKHKAVRDTDMYRFKNELLRRLQERWRMLPDVPLDIPISLYGQV